MKCPHCVVEIHADEKFDYIESDPNGSVWGYGTQRCPACNNVIIRIINAGTFYDRTNGFGAFRKAYYVHPKTASRAPLSPEVPKEYGEDYIEACLVLGDSPKASAALSRRCLQHLLRGAAKVKHSDLAKEIQEVLDRNTLPSHLAESIDTVRNIGNFAAHPMKEKNTGDILPVEPGEAEWNLDTLEGLFDFYFVAPAIAKKKKDALNQKLQKAGKPPAK